MDRGEGQYLARSSPTTSGWEVFDRSTQTTREHGLDQADAEQLAAELNENNRMYLDPRTVRVLVDGRWRFGTATACSPSDAPPDPAAADAAHGARPTTR